MRRMIEVSWWLQAGDGTSNRRARIVPLGERHFRRTVAKYVEHYHRERNHQGLANELIDPVASQCAGRVCRRPRLGGLLNYYTRAT
jgi:putative transposase